MGEGNSSPLLQFVICNMKKISLLLALVALILTSCTVTVEDKRLTREEVAAAFQERDKALSVLSAAVKSLQNKEVEK